MLTASDQEASTPQKATRFPIGILSNYSNKSIIFLKKFKMGNGTKEHFSFKIKGEVKRRECLSTTIKWKKINLVINLA
jgi:hypothetical protein